VRLQHPPSCDLGMHASERILSESGDQAQRRVDVTMFDRPQVSSAEIVKVAVQHLDRQCFIRSRQRSSALLGHFQVPSCMSGADRGALSSSMWSRPYSRKVSNSR